MDLYLSPYSIPPLLSAILFLILGGFVFLKNKKSIVNITFGLICCVTLWWQLSWFILFNTKNEILANYLVKIGYAGIIFIPIFFYHFILSFLKEIKKFDKYLLYVSYLLGLVFEITLITTNYFINGFYRYFWGFYPKANFLHLLYLLLLSILAIRTLYLLFFSLKKKRGIYPIEYHQIKYILWGIIFYIFASSDFLVNYGVEFYPLGFLFILIFLGITAYTIVKQELFGIRVVLTQALVGVIAVVLLTQAITSRNLLEFSWKFAIFIVFVYFGYLLIKSVLDEIKRRTELQKLYEEVDRLSKTKSEFLSIASHQLRTPLTAIKGYISMILEGTYGKLAERQIKPLDNVYQSNERLIKLVNDLLDLSRLDMGKVEFTPQLASLEELVSGTVNDLKINAEKKGLYINLVKPVESLPKIMFDQGKLRQVILNIIDNAIKYTKKGGITIELKKLDSRVQIKISDTGEGMTDGEMKNLFQMFSRATAGTQLHTEGAGIGLYVAKKFIEMHKGQIWAESEGKGKGSRFYIELPMK